MEKHSVSGGTQPVWQLVFEVLDQGAALNCVARIGDDFARKLCTVASLQKNFSVRTFSRMDYYGCRNLQSLYRLVHLAATFE